MPLNCDPSSLAQAAACMSCLSPATHMEVQTYLLAIMAGQTPDPNALAAAAKSFQSLNPPTLAEIQVMLLCSIAQNLGL